MQFLAWEREARDIGRTEDSLKGVQVTSFRRAATTCMSCVPAPRTQDTQPIHPTSQGVIALPTFHHPFAKLLCDVGWCISDVELSADRLGTQPRSATIQSNGAHTCRKCHAPSLRTFSGERDFEDSRRMRTPHSGGVFAMEGGARMSVPTASQSLTALHQVAVLVDSVLSLQAVLHALIGKCLLISERCLINGRASSFASCVSAGRGSRAERFLISPFIFDEWPCVVVADIRSVIRPGGSFQAPWVVRKRMWLA